MTELLYHDHSYMQTFDATVTAVADAGVALDPDGLLRRRRRPAAGPGPAVGRRTAIRSLGAEARRRPTAAPH